MSSIDEYLADPKRICHGGSSLDFTESLRNQPTDERINTCFGYLQNDSLSTVPGYIPDLCNDLVKRGRKEDLQHLLELVKDSPVHGREPIYDSLLLAFMQEEPSYSKALKQFISILGKPSEMCIGYIARKILSHANDNIGSFLDELKLIVATGHKFNVTEINKLMMYCNENFNMNFHQFVLTRILNKLPAEELNKLNQDILTKFANRRLAHVKQQRMGLPRKK